MYGFLKSVRLESIRRLVSHYFPIDQREYIATAKRHRILAVLFSIHGYDILYDRAVRLMLLQELPKKRLEKMAKQLNVKVMSKAYDTCLGLASLNWRVGAKVVWCFAEEFVIDLEYLPSRLNTLPSIETIEPYTPPPKLFDYQEDICRQLTTLLNTTNSGSACVIQLPTGAGKTRTAMEAIVDHWITLSYEGMRVVWLAHAAELCEQAVDTFLNIWQKNGDHEVQIVRLWGRHSVNLNEVGEAFIVASFQKTHALITKEKKKLEQLWPGIKLLVVDEAHKALAPTFKSAIEYTRKRTNCFLLGLTATPGRGTESNQQNRQLANLFGGRLIRSNLLSEDPISTLQERGILAKIQLQKKRTGAEIELSDEEERLTSFSGDLPTSVLRRLAKNQRRNELIVDIVMDQISDSRLSLVFACSVKHAKELSLAVGIRGGRAAFVDCNMKRNLRRRVVNSFRAGDIDVIFNYGVLSTGFDAPNVGTVIIARPTSSVVLYSQMVGRGLRGALVGGKENCRLIDLKDNFDNYGGVNEVYGYFDPYWS